MRKTSGAALAAICAVALGACSTAGSGGVAARSGAAAAGRYNAVGVASWYGRKHHGRLTASGEPFDMNALTAAHRTLPFGTEVRVTNLANGRHVVVTINDRGPALRSRIIDLSRAAAARLDFLREGVTRVRVEAVHG